MYENTLSVPQDNKYIFDYVVTALSRPLCRANALSTVACDGKRNYFTYACADVYSHCVSDDVADVVAEALSLGYKNKYLRTLLGVSADNFYQNVLVNVICVFDSVVDKQAVRRLVEPDRPLFLDGYYNFRMGQMKRKWNELSQLVGANRYVLEDNSLVVEFLQYLTEQVEGKREAMSVVFDSGNDYFLFDGGNKLLPAMRTLAERVTAEEEAIVNLVCMRPSRLTVYAKTKPSQDFCDLAGALFDVDYKTV